MIPAVQAFFEQTTSSYSYVVSDPATGHCAIIDPLLNYQASNGRISTTSADAIVDYVQTQKLKTQWVLETHPHADHLSAAQYLKSTLGGRTGIGRQIGQVQRAFADLFNLGCEFNTAGEQFDVLFDDENRLPLGELSGRVIQTPGHTPACVTYLFGGIAFVGDTLFMPDYGTARTDFPGGDAASLYASIRKILSLAPQTTLYMCHDYGTEQRLERCNQTTVAEQCRSNVHIHNGVSAQDFVALRTERDAGLATPALLMPAIQFNIRAGNLPPAEDNDVHYFKIPVRL